MRIVDDASEATFRADVRAWLRRHLDGTRRGAIERALASGDLGPSREWQALLYASGYAVRSWPQAYGGHGGTIADDLILFEELAEADAPNDVFRVGTRNIGPVIIKLGTDKQKEALLRKTASGEIMWSQGFSEPAAGSDLASLTTRAERQSDGTFLLNGLKVWNTFGHFADHCLILARTNTAVPKHKGLTAFIVPLTTAGIAVRPIPQMSGRSDFNELFITDVRVPDTAVLGQIDGGWAVAAAMLDYERRGLAALGFACQRNFRRLLETATKLRTSDDHSLAEQPAVRRRLAELSVQARISVLNNHRFAQLVPEGATPGAEASIQKLQSSELNKLLYGVALDLTMAAGLGDPAASANLQQASEDYLGSFGFTMGGGTAQIQRNIIAERVLGLPR